MRTIAVYNLKGGVGKTTTAVNLAWSAVNKSSRRTLLWDLDPQGASSHLIGNAETAKDEARSIFSREIRATKMTQPSTVDGLDLLAADQSLRDLDHLLFNLGKGKRLKKLLEGLARKYDRVILDCPPGLNETADQVLRAADLVIVPVIPSPLSQRALTEVRDYIDRQKGSHAPILPIYTMVDRRRALHKQALARHPEWPVIPMASAVERMAEERKPLGAFDPKCPAGQAYARLWSGIEKKLAKLD
ncbi:MAG: ParA family protein [Blastomonas sp.]